MAFSTTDPQSGIDHYEILEGSDTVWHNATSPYRLTDQSLSSNIYIRAVDGAGNFRVVELPAENSPHPEISARADGSGRARVDSATINSIGDSASHLEMETNMPSNKIFDSGVRLVALAGVFCAHSAFSGDVIIFPFRRHLSFGPELYRSVNVSSPDQPMNAAQGEISFPTGELEVLSVSKTNSILNLWVQDPTFSNYDGTVDFSGVAVNPGFQGNNGTVLR